MQPTTFKQLWPFSGPHPVIDGMEGLGSDIKKAVEMAIEASYFVGVSHGILGAIILLLMGVCVWWVLKKSDLNAKTACLVALLGALLWYAGRVSPPPATPVKPGPSPAPQPAPKKPWLPWRQTGDAISIEKLSLGGPVAPDDKTQVACDLPTGQRKKNIASRGLGCCVFRSLDHAGHWQNVPALYDMPEWMVQSGIPGGGYPQKVDQLIPRIAHDRNAAKPNYLQYTDGSDLSILKAALDSGRMPCVTYNGHDQHYGQNTTIAHMVNLVCLTDQWACILDNNFIGEAELVWMTPEEFKQRWAAGGAGWAVILLNPPPPPPPHH